MKILLISILAIKLASSSSRLSDSSEATNCPVEYPEDNRHPYLKLGDKIISQEQ